MTSKYTNNAVSLICSHWRTHHAASAQPNWPVVPFEAANKLFNQFLQRFRSLPFHVSEQRLNERSKKLLNRFDLLRMQMFAVCVSPILNPVALPSNFNETSPCRIANHFCILRQSSRRRQLANKQCVCIWPELGACMLYDSIIDAEVKLKCIFSFKCTQAEICAYNVCVLMPFVDIKSASSIGLMHVYRFLSIYY